MAVSSDHVMEGGARTTARARSRGTHRHPSHARLRRRAPLL